MPVMIRELIIRTLIRPFSSKAGQTQEKTLQQAKADAEAQAEQILKQTGPRPPRR